ncbi:MAG: hypothetical protein WC759_04995 [Candidatus Micrarchaeia archaeon]
MSADFFLVRAFASVMLAAALLFPLVLFLAVQARADAGSEEMLADARAAEANYYAGEGTLNAAFNVMAGVATEKKPGDARSIRETLEESGAQLAELGAFIGEMQAGKGVDSTFWCGKFSEEEKAGLARRMAAEKRALKCDSCFDASARIMLAGANVAEKKPEAKFVPACAFFVAVVPELAGSGKIGAGNSLLVHMAEEDGTALVAPELAAAGITPWSPAAIGISIYDERTGAASVSYISAGEMRDYK